MLFMLCWLCGEVSQLCCLVSLYGLVLFAITTTMLALTHLIIVRLLHVLQRTDPHCFTLFASEVLFVDLFFVFNTEVHR